MSSAQEQKGPIRRFPAGFWTAFNCWWHAEYQRTQARPTSKAISRWHGEHSIRVWGDAAVCLAETQRHANRMKPRRSAAAVAYIRRDSFDGEDMDEECGPASGAAFDAQGGDALQSADSLDDARDTLDAEAAAAAAAAAAATAEELNTSCLPGGIAKLMNADSDMPAPAGAAVAGVGAPGPHGQHVAAMQQRFSINGNAAGAPPASIDASPAPTAVGTCELLPRWMQPDPVHSAHHMGDAPTPHAVAATTTTANGAVSAMGQWDSSYSLNTINQQQPCTSASHAHEAACGGMPAFPADARAQRGQLAGLKRGFDDSGCCGVEAASGPEVRRIRGGSNTSLLMGTDLVGAASSSNNGSAASAAWMRRADRELNELMRDMGMLVEDDGCGLAAHANAGDMRGGLVPLRLPDPRPQRDLSSLLLLRGQAAAGHGPFEQQQQQQLAAPRQVTSSNWQLLLQVQVQPQQAMRSAPGNWQLQRGVSVGGYEIEALDSVPLEALL